MRKNRHKARRAANAAAGGGWEVKPVKSAIIRSQQDDIGRFVKGFYNVHGKVMSRLAHE
jgi:hypothetical protein